LGYAFVLEMQSTRHPMSGDKVPPEPNTAIQVRLRGPLYMALENWRRSRPTIPARSEALRELIERALENGQT
jgi:hypothetical protein